MIAHNVAWLVRKPSNNMIFKKANYIDDESITPTDSVHLFYDPTQFVEVII
ncbi:hypothetical protein VCRA219O19_10140 [Vibrio crassostreae]|nr:hypothetical protein VCRA219O19_10140 [Vibrio crassostreae]